MDRAPNIIVPFTLDVLFDGSFAVDARLGDCAHPDFKIDVEVDSRDGIVAVLVEVTPSNGLHMTRVRELEAPLKSRVEEFLHRSPEFWKAVYERREEGAE